MHSANATAGKVRGSPWYLLVIAAIVLLLAIAIAATALVTTKRFIDDTRSTGAVIVRVSSSNKPDVVLHALPPLDHRPSVCKEPFPVDFVMTYVNPWDLQWRQTARATHARMVNEAIQRARAKGLTSIDDEDLVLHDLAREPVMPSHAEDKDEAYYCVHTAAAFLPWLRRIWIVSQRPQTPPWLTGATILGIPVTVVHHDTFFDPEVTCQPTYNSNMIEAQLPNIPDLAEHFIYSNDDFFVLRPLRRRDFFTDDGTPVVRLFDTRHIIPMVPNAWGKHLRTMQVVCRDVGLPDGCFTPDHVAVPLRKSTFKTVVAKLKGAIAKWKAYRGNHDFPLFYIVLNVAPVVPPRDDLEASYYENGDDFVNHKGALPHLACVNHTFRGKAAQRMQRILDAAVYAQSSS